MPKHGSDVSVRRISDAGAEAARGAYSGAGPVAKNTWD
jgi:hypothetical protein